MHSCAPFALGWGQSIVAAGADARVSFYDMDGGLLRTFDYAEDGATKDFGVAAFNPTGEAVVVGNFDKFYVYGLTVDTAAAAAPTGGRGGGAPLPLAPSEWTEVSIRTVPHMYTVTALAWKPDGSKLAVGTLTGGVDLYDACVKKTRYRGKFEFTYVLRRGAGSLLGVCVLFSSLLGLL